MSALERLTKRDLGATRACEGDADTIVEASHEHTWATDRVAIGSGVWTREDVVALADEGITHVIDCRSTANAGNLYVGSGVEWIHIGTADDCEPKTPPYFHRGIAFARAAFESNPAAKLLVHCFAGINRGPSMAYAILRAVLCMSAVGSEAAIRATRPLAGLRYMADAERAVSQ